MSERNYVNVHFPYWKEIPAQVLTLEESHHYLDCFYNDLLQNSDAETFEQFKDKALPFMEKYGYFEYPASVKYHLNQEGGLFRHSVKLTLNALNLNDLWFQLPRWKVILSGLFHDLGKIGMVCFKTGKQWSRYKRNPLWDYVKTGPEFFDGAVDDKIGFSRARLKPGVKHDSVKTGDWLHPFEYGQDYNNSDKSAVYMDMTDLDALLPVQLMTLPADVIQACKFADGLYVKSNTTYSLKVHPLAHLIHFSDLYTGIIQEGGWLING